MTRIPNTERQSTDMESDINIKQAHFTDIAGRICPPRVAELVSAPGGWGLVVLIDSGRHVVQDEMGFLWAKRDCRLRLDEDVSHGRDNVVVMYWTPSGVGLWIPREAVKYVGFVTREEAAEDNSIWLPISEASNTKPDALPEGIDLDGGAAQIATSLSEILSPHLNFPTIQP